MSTRIGRALATGVLVALAALALYLWLTPAEILGGDNAEFATLSAVGGVAHPSGYPLYVIWLRALAWLPAATPAQAAARATAILGAAQVLMLITACRRWGASTLAAALVAALYAGGPLPLLLHTEAEVFALLGLLAATLLWLSAPRGPVVGLPRVAALGLCAGLGLANHLSCALLAPLGLWAAARGIRESRHRLLAVTAGLGALAVGLLPYLTLLRPPAGGLVWGNIDGARALIDHALRRDYGLMRLSPQAGEHGVASRAALANLAALGMSCLRGWLGLPLLIAAWWVVHAIRARPAESGEQRMAAPALPELPSLDQATAPGRAPWLAWLASFLLCGPLFVATFNLAPQGLASLVVARFHLLPTLLLTLPIACGLTRLIGHGSNRGMRLRQSALVGFAIPPLVLVTSAALSLEGLGRAHAPAVERFLVNTARALPANAVLIGTGDHQVFGFAYLRLARGVRPDIVYIDWELMSHAWYRAQIAARLGFPPIPEAAGANAPASVRMARGLLSRGRPVFVDSYAQRNIVAALPSYPLGTVIRVLPDGARPPAPEQVVRENLALLEAFDLRYPRPAAADGWAAFVQERYAAPWIALSRIFDRLGRPEEASVQARRAAALAPLP